MPALLGDVDSTANPADDELRRKLRQLSGPGGALESDSRGAPEMFAPSRIGSPKLGDGGAASSSTTAAGVSDELLQEAREGLVDLGDVFSDKGLPRRRGQGERAGEASGVGEAEVQTGDEQDERDGASDNEWGSFDEDDWRGGDPEGRGSDTDGVIGEAPPRGSSVDADVPGMLGGARFTDFGVAREASRDGGGDDEGGTPTR